MKVRFQFDRLQVGLFRVKCQVGYIGIVSGTAGKWRAEVKGKALTPIFQTRTQAAQALSNQRLV